MGSPYDLSEAFAQAFDRGDFATCEQLAASAQGYETTEHALVSLADHVAAKASLETKEALKSIQRRWMHDAALNGQQWARDRIAMEWAKKSDPEYMDPCWPNGKKAGDDGAIAAGTVHQWLVQAARRGNREAAAWAGIVDPHDVDSLLIAWGAGKPNGIHLPATAARLGVHYASIGSDEAGRWFDLAIEGDGWHEWDTTWTATKALAEYMGWAHQRDTLLCGALSRLLIEDAVQNGQSDRLELIEEGHKPWRLDYRRAKSSEAARHRALRHCIEAHCTDPSSKLMTLAALVDNTFFGRPWENDDRGDQELALRVLAEIRGAPVDLDQIDRLTWNFMAYVLRTAIPTILRSARCDTEAAFIEQQAISLDFTAEGRLFPAADRADDQEYFAPYQPPSLDPISEAESALAHFFAVSQYALDRLLSATSDGYESAPYSLRRRFELDEAAQFLVNCGLPLSEIDAQARLFHGRKLWVAMRLAEHNPPPEGMTRAYWWSNTWHDLSDLLLRTARVFIRHRKGVVETQDPDEIGFSCQALKADGNAQIRELRELAE